MSRKCLLDCSASGAIWADDVHAAQVLPRLKLRRFQTKKYLLKVAMKDYLPKEVLLRPKAGLMCR